MHGTEVFRPARAGRKGGDCALCCLLASRNSPDAESETSLAAADRKGVEKTIYIMCRQPLNGQRCQISWLRKTSLLWNVVRAATPRLPGGGRQCAGDLGCGGGLAGCDRFAKRDRCHPARLGTQKSTSALTSDFKMAPRRRQSDDRETHRSTGARAELSFTILCTETLQPLFPKRQHTTADATALFKKSPPARLSQYFRFSSSPITLECEILAPRLFHRSS